MAICRAVPRWMNFSAVATTPEWRATAISLMNFWSLKSWQWRVGISWTKTSCIYRQMGSIPFHATETPKNVSTLRNRSYDRLWVGAIPKDAWLRSKPKVHKRIILVGCLFKVRITTAMCLVAHAGYTKEWTFTVASSECSVTEWTVSYSEPGMVSSSTSSGQYHFWHFCTRPTCPLTIFVARTKVVSTFVPDVKFRSGLCVFLAHCQSCGTSNESGRQVRLLSQPRILLPQMKTFQCWLRRRKGRAAPLLIWNLLFCYSNISLLHFSLAPF